MVSYCVKSIAQIANFVLGYNKIQELRGLNSAVEQNIVVSETILSYTRLIQNEVVSLMHVYFRSAFENLNYALTSSGENRCGYICQAKNAFINAITVERNENLIFSYIGLAFCQMIQGEEENSVKTLGRIKDVCCTLPDNYEGLLSHMKPDKLWHDLFFRFMPSFDPNWKKYFPRGRTPLVLSTLELVGEVMGIDLVWSLYPKKEPALRAFLKSEFEAFKMEILKQFEIK